MRGPRGPHPRNPPEPRGRVEAATLGVGWWSLICGFRSVDLDRFGLFAGCRMTARCARSHAAPSHDLLAGVAPTPHQLRRCVRDPLPLLFPSPFSRCGCGSMVECGLPKPETRVRFPSPAPIFSSAFSQFSRSLSCECHTTPPRLARFPLVSSPGIEPRDQGQMSFVCRWDHSSLLGMNTRWSGIIHDSSFAHSYKRLV